MTRLILTLMAFALGYSQGVRRERAWWTRGVVRTAEKVVRGVR